MGRGNVGLVFVFGIEIRAVEAAGLFQIGNEFRRNAVEGSQIGQLFGADLIGISRKLFEQRFVGCIGGRFGRQVGLGAKH